MPEAGGVSAAVVAAEAEATKAAAAKAEAAKAAAVLAESLRSAPAAPTAAASLPSRLYAGLDISGQTALVTGASAGIGAAIAWRLAELGCKLVLVARREERLKELQGQIVEKFPGTQIYVHPLDLSDVAAVGALPSKLPAGFNEVHILVNNAGLALGVNPCDKNDAADIQTMMTTNVTSLMVLTQAFSAPMRARYGGHIINLSSIAAHFPYPGGSIYCATKAAVNAFSIAARSDLVGTPVRVTNISPGMVETEFSQVRFKGDTDKAANVYKDLVALRAEDIADNVVYSLTRPAHVQIADIVVWPTNQSGPQIVARAGPNLGKPDQEEL